MEQQQQSEAVVQHRAENAKSRPFKSDPIDVNVVFSPETVDELVFISQGTRSRRQSQRSDDASRRASESSEAASTSSTTTGSSTSSKLTKASVRLGDAEYNQLNQYIIIKDLGRGVHAKVTLGLNTADNKLYAVKATTSATAVAETAVRKEIAVLKKLNHDNVLKLFEVIDDDETNELLIVLEYAAGGPIFTRYNRVPLMESTLLRYARDIVQGLDYLHNAVGIAHMDLKPENLLKSADGTVKIADFGVSFIGERKNRAPSAVKRIVGTPAFIAPEMLDETGYDPYIADIWSLGICLFHMATAHLPFIGKTIFQIIAMAKRQGLRFPPEPSLSVELQYLISAILEIDPKRRATIAEIMAHPWITSKGENPLPPSLTNRRVQIEVTEAEVEAAVRHDPLAALLRPRFKTLQFAPGEFILRKGEVGDTMYFINAGECEVLMDALTSEDEAAHSPEEIKTGVLAVRSAGEYIGELAVMEAIQKSSSTGAVGKRTASVRARGHVECLSVTVKDMLIALKKDKEGKDRLFRTASFRLEQNEEIMLQLAEAGKKSRSVNVHFNPVRKLQVLYAEDSMPTQFIVKRLMKRIGGVELTCVSDGKAALEHCEKSIDGGANRMDIILMDCQMPVMNGLEATVAIRNLDNAKVSRVPIVAVSSGIKAMNQKECMEAGMDDYVAKPLNQATLVDVLVRNLPPELMESIVDVRDV